MKKIKLSALSSDLVSKVEMKNVLGGGSSKICSCCSVKDLEEHGVPESFPHDLESNYYNGFIIPGSKISDVILG